MHDPTDNAEWSRVFAHLSHDVRSTTSGAITSLDIFALARSDDDREKAAKLLRSSLERLIRLADDLRDVSGVLAARVAPTPVQHDLVMATRRACDRLAGDARLRGVEVAVAADGVPTHVVIGNSEAWDRALVRLIESGLQRVSGKGRLVVSFERGPRGVDLFVPCGPLELPVDAELRAAWATPSPEGRMFALGLWLARAFLVAQGGELSIREDGDQRQLVASLPSAAS
jgi:signal transduction histidine kinase